MTKRGSTKFYSYLQIGTYSNKRRQKFSIVIHSPWATALLDVLIKKCAISPKIYPNVNSDKKVIFLRFQSPLEAMVHRHSFCVYLDVDFADVAFKDVVVGADRRHYGLIMQFFNLTIKIEIFSSFMIRWTFTIHWSWTQTSNIWISWDFRWGLFEFQITVCFFFKSE